MAKADKLNELLREELAYAVNREVIVPNTLITISYVECSTDLKQARIGFSVLPDNMVGTATRKLNSSISQLVGILRSRLKLRKIPHLIWEFDATEKEASKIERLIAQANEDDDEELAEDDLNKI
ncbi:MAG: ribosome-binding factor A [Patescibacteria group bacterium]